MLDLLDGTPKLLLPVQKRASCIWARVVLDLVCQPAKVAGDLLDARDRVLRRHSGSLARLGSARLRSDHALTSR